mgnify:FL=1
MAPVPREAQGYSCLSGQGRDYWQAQVQVVSVWESLLAWGGAPGAWAQEGIQGTRKFTKEHTLTRWNSCHPRTFKSSRRFSRVS